MKFPILRINNDHIRKFNSLAELKLMSQRYLDEGRFKKQAFFIDSSGFRYDLREVKKVRGSRNPLRWFRPSPAIVVEVDAGSPTQITLEKAKDLILGLVLKNGWHHQGSQSESEFREMLDQATSFRGLIDLISFYGEWQG
jgi:hypothetical protein